MPEAVKLRGDWDAAQVEAAARQCTDANQYRRLQAIGGIYCGMSRGAAAQLGGMDRQTLRDWVHRFNATGPAGLIDHKAPGKRPKLDAAQKAVLAEIVGRGADINQDGIVRWRCSDLVDVIEQRFDVAVSKVTVGRILKELGFSRVSARPQHPGQDAIAGFKKTSARG